MVSSGEKKYKYFVVYRDDAHQIKPLRIMLPKTTAYIKCWADETKRMYFSIGDDELLQNCNGI